MVYDSSKLFFQTGIIGMVSTKEKDPSLEREKLSREYIQFHFQTIESSSFNSVTIIILEQ